MDGTTPGPAAPAQTPESTGLPSDLFAKAQAAAAEERRPIDVYRAERAGQYTSKWDAVAGATPAAVIQPLPAVDAPAASTLSSTASAGDAVPVKGAVGVPNRPPDASAPGGNAGARLTMYAAGRQTVEWDGAVEVTVEDSERVVRFRDANGAAVRVVVGGGSNSVVTPEAPWGIPHGIRRTRSVVGRAF